MELRQVGHSLTLQELWAEATTMMAQTAMKAGVTDDCMMHMKEAEKAMGKM